MSDQHDLVRLLGRRIEFHDASRRYPIRRAVAQLPGPDLAELEPISRLWSIPAFLDQGVRLAEFPDWDPSGCTGFSRAHACAAEPVSRPLTPTEAFALYRAAQHRDQWPETPPAEGSSVIAAVEAASAIGLVESFWWGFTLDEIVKSLGHVGPGVAGSWWTDGMFTPDPRGFVHPTGPDVGGHAYCLLGVILELNAAVIAQTWGRWSSITDDRTLLYLRQLGLPADQVPYVGLIDLDELWALLLRDGEYCISLDVALEPLPEPKPPPTPEPEPEPAEPGCLPLASARRAWRRLTGR